MYFGLTTSQACYGLAINFEQALLPLIERAHGGKNTHSGKVPTKVPKDTKKFVELSQLRQQLEQAVRDEDYELAAKLRDKMKQFD